MRNGYPLAAVEQELYLARLEDKTLVSQTE
jgi:hypothetical protein